MGGPAGPKIFRFKTSISGNPRIPPVSEVLRNTVTATDPKNFRPCGAKIKYSLVLYTPGSVMKHRTIPKTMDRGGGVKRQDIRC